MPREPLSSPRPQALAPDRRGYVRYPRSLEALWQFLGLAPRDLAMGMVVDLSSAGVGLELDRPFTPETRLMLRLPTRTCHWVSHLVRVKRCQPTEDGAFLVGCQFVRPLTPDQLEAHLA